MPPRVGGEEGGSCFPRAGADVPQACGPAGGTSPSRTHPPTITHHKCTGPSRTAGQSAVWLQRPPPFSSLPRVVLQSSSLRTDENIPRPQGHRLTETQPSSPRPPRKPRGVLGGAEEKRSHGASAQRGPWTCPAIPARLAFPISVVGFHDSDPVKDQL